MFSISRSWSFVYYALLCFAVVFVVGVLETEARNIASYRDLISTSAPGAYANHTLSFVLGTDVAPGGYIEITPPPGFTVSSTPLFSARNVELAVGGVSRPASTVAAPGIDGVTIIPGSPGLIRYTLAPDSGLQTDDKIEIRIGNHTSVSQGPQLVFSTTTGTTTSPGDIRPIKNATTTGTHAVQMEIFEGASVVADAGFLIALVQQVSAGPADTTETIPPLRFNGSPTSTVGGTTLNVEIALETDEFSICRYSTASSTPYSAMPNTFSNTGLIFHTTVVPVTPGSVATFYVRCIDDEGNFNIDDYIIEFTVNDQPTGTANSEGSISGDGSGSGNDGSGDGSGSGGETGNSSGETPLEGGDAGTGGSGGGGGGGGGGRTGTTAGGGFESTDGPYESGDARVVISGYAFPRSVVSILVDGKAAGQTTANQQGAYEITLDQIARGAYTFGVYATDSNRIKSSTFSTSFTVSGARTSSLSNINIAPSIAVTPDPVDPGATLTLRGYALPNAVVTIENGPSSGAVSTLTASSDASGAWSVNVDTSTFSRGTYQVRAKAEQSSGISIKSNFSTYTFYGVGQAADVPLNTDLNRDGRVNLTDFSILLFWWNSNGGDSDPPADINQDSRVNLTDFSILLFNWTG